MAKRRNPKKKAEPPRKPKSPAKPKSGKLASRAAPAQKAKRPAKQAKAISTPKPAIAPKRVVVSLERSEDSKKISARKKEEKVTKPAKPEPQKTAGRPRAAAAAPRKKAAETGAPARAKTKESGKKPAGVFPETPSPSFHVMEPRPATVLAPSPEYIPEPPARYGITRLVLMTRDPDWAFAYWEITPDTVHQVSNRIGTHNWNQSRHILRIYDVTNLDFNGANAHNMFDIEVSPHANNWYVRMPASDRSYIADIGILTPYGEFIMLARSNVISMPRSGVSDILDEEWATINYEELFRLSGGFRAGALGGGSAFMMEEISKRLRSELEMGSMAVSSFSGQPGPEKEKKFWLVVNTELIVYGATEPDANVTVQDVPVRLNPDGTFSLRFALPDGQQVIPVKAMSSDGTMEQKITPIVKRTTE